MATKRKPISITFQGKNTEVPLTAYAFDRAGNLLSSTPVKDSVDVEKLGAERVLVGPTIPQGGRENPSLASLRRMQAVEITRSTALSTIILPDDIVTLWKWCICTIRGRVVRTIEGVDYPVCNVRVKVCEVDKWPWLIYSLLDREIFAIRNDLLLREPIQIVPRRPFPDPPPDVRRIAFKTGDVAAPPHEGHAEMSVSTNVAEAAPVALKAVTAESRSAFRSAAENLPANVKAGLASENANVVRQTLANSFDFISPIIYYWPWLHYYYSCEDLGTVTTDDDGRFTLWHWYLCHGDKPDIHFSVQAFIGGAWTTVYNPPKSTGTYWNYACGTEVTIRITDERVSVCLPTYTFPGSNVVVTMIGNNINVARIQRESAGVNQGLTEVEAALGTGRPFGGQLEPRVAFGNAMVRDTNELPPLFYYRWSYRRLGTTGTFTVLDTPVYRRYMVEPTSPPGAAPEFRLLQLGPVPGKPTTMFMVPPKNPFDPDGPSSWHPLNLRTELASAFFPTNFGDALANAGKYELLLELFDASGNLIPDWVAAGINGFIPNASTPAPVAPTTVTSQQVTGVPSMSEYYRIPAGMTTHGMRLVVHVDNNVCSAAIDAITSTGFSAVDDNCGFYVYTSLANEVTIGFTASHPNDFATFNFDIHKGASNPVNDASADGRVGASQDGFAESGGHYTKTVTVGTLLGGCPNAAFSETLHVDAMATDGWSIDLGYDANGVPRAFALSNS